MAAKTPSEEEIFSFFYYETVPGQVIYSTALTNQSKWETAADIDVTISIWEGSIYVNDAKIVISDVLIANGVLHVVDKYLNSSDAGARPWTRFNTIATSSQSQGGSGLSTGARAGIGVGATLGVIAIIAAVVLLRKRSRSSRNSDRPEVSSKATYLQEKDGASMLRHEMTTKSYDAAEMDAQRRPHELDGSTPVGQHSDISTEGHSSHSTRQHF